MIIAKQDGGDGCGSVLYVVRGTQYALRMDDSVMLVNGPPEWMSEAEARRTAAVLLAAADDMDSGGTK